MSLIHFIENEHKTPRKREKMASFVCVVGREPDYTAQEISLLEAFSSDHLSWDNGLGRDKRHSLYVTFQKNRDGSWFYHKEPWQQKYTKPNLAEALAAMYAVCNLPLPPDLLAIINPRHVETPRGEVLHA